MQAVLAQTHSAAEAAPVTRIKDPRNIVAQLQQIPAVIDRYDRGDRILAAQRMIVGKKVNVATLTINA